MVLVSARRGGVTRDMEKNPLNQRLALLLMMVLLAYEMLFFTLQNGKIERLLNPVNSIGYLIL